MSEKTLIWEGRFQPIHKGHVAYVERLLSFGHPVVLVVVANEVHAESERASVVPEFSAIVDPHHASEKNPWPLFLRHKMVVSTLTDRFPDADLTVLAGHRLDLDWDLYKTLLPPNRIFAVPTRDDFEDHKAAAWESLGEEVMRVDVADLPPVSGTAVREAMAGARDLSELLLPTTQRLVESYQVSVK